MIATFHRALEPRAAAEVGAERVVLVEGPARKSVDPATGAAMLTGRTDTNKRVVFARRPVPSRLARSDEGARGSTEAEVEELRAGDYVAVRVTAALSANTLRAEPLARTSIAAFAARHAFADDEEDEDEGAAAEIVR